MEEIDTEAIEDIATGATVLGAGGGGDPYVGKLMAKQAIKENGAVELVEPGEVDDNSLVVPGAMMGAPTVMVEKVPNRREVLHTFEAIENYLGSEVDATMPAEAGGVNSMIPFFLGAELDVPVVDADGMGRAFPELQMVTFGIESISSTPMALADEKGNNLILNTISNKWTEELARNATTTMGGSVMIAIYPMSGEQMKHSAIKKSLSKAKEIGEAIRTAKEKERNPIEVLEEVTGGYSAFEGKIVDVDRKTKEGFVQGTAEIQGINNYKNQKLTLNFQNEHLVAKLGDEVLVSVPDLITVHDIETGQPITTEGMRYGSRVTVLGIPCDDKWRTEEGLELVGPQYFGYDIEYKPVEQRIQEATK